MMQKENIRIVVLASGRGSNFRAIVEALEGGRIPGAQLVTLITDRPQTGAEEFARSRGIVVRVLPFKEFPSRNHYDEALWGALKELDPGLILTLGYMRIIHSDLVEAYRGRIINIHPSLLPAFPGMHSQRQAFEYGVKVTGATVHFMDEGVDTGPIILQAPVAVPSDADEDGLAALILKEEHRILEEAVRLFCSGALRIEGRRVRIDS